MNRKERRTAKSLSRKSKKGNGHTIEQGQNNENTAWDDLENLYLECKALSMQVVKVIPLMNNMEALKKLNVKDRPKVAELAKVISSDFQEYMKRLDEIRANHKGKSGGYKDEDELMEIIVIGEKYSKWMSSFQLVLLPTVGQFSDYFDKGDETPPLEETPTTTSH